MIAVALYSIQAEQRFALEGVGAVDRFLANPAYLVLPIWLGLSLYVLVAALSGVLFTPALKRQLQLVRTQITDIITMAPLAIIIYLMVVKPT